MIKNAVLACLLFSFFVARSMAANFFITPAPSGEKHGYILYGNLLKSDLIYKASPSGYDKDNVRFLYEMQDGNYWENNSAQNYCPSNLNIESTLQFLNKMLNAGVPLNTPQSYAKSKENTVRIYCYLGPKSQNLGNWTIYSNFTIRPVFPDSPKCTTTINPDINFGNVIMGEVAQFSASGIIRCDKDAAVSVSLINRDDPASTSGVLKLDDATVKYNVDNAGTTKRYTARKYINEPFTLNFILSDTGKTIAKKTGYLILRIENL